MSKVYPVPELWDTLHPVFAQHGVRNAGLFGSCAKGQATERSDVDLLVHSGLRGLAFFGLLESVVTAPDVPVDPIDREIRKSGVQIYRRQAQRACEAQVC